MVHVANSTLAGGVAIGTTANVVLHPLHAALVGTGAAIISVLGYAYLTVVFSVCSPNLIVQISLAVFWKVEKYVKQKKICKITAAEIKTSVCGLFKISRKIYNKLVISLNESKN